MHAQNIEFTFENAQIINDGMDDFYEVDVMIAAIDGQADFKLGSGLLYINYNTSAFGSNISASGAAVVTYPNPDYILGGKNILDYYNNFLLSDNTTSRIGFSFQQFLSSGGMTTENVTATPKKLFHLAIKFIDSGLDPMITFEDNETQPPGVNNARDQFFTACGPSGSLAGADCGSEPGTQFQDAIFTSDGATLSTENDWFASNVNVYPNPTVSRLFINTSRNNELKIASLYDLAGKKILTKTQNLQEINLQGLQNGIYFLRLENETGYVIKKVIKQ